MREDGRRVRRFSVPRWLVRAAVGLSAVAVAANVALVAGYASLRHDRIASVAPSVQVAPGPLPPAAEREHPAAPPAERAPAPDPPATTNDQLAATREELAATRAQLAAAREQLAQKTRALEPLERRLAEVRDEVRNWDGLHAAILKPLAGERRTHVAASGERARAAASGSALEAVNTVLARVREESQRLRGLARITRETADILASVPSRLPLRAAINSGFGMRTDPFRGERQFHAGIDLAAATGTPVAAAAGGVVLVAGAASGYGNTVVLDHGRGFETRYGHLDSVRVAKGQRVERGQPIGLSGNTGRSTAPHLHYEVLVDGRPVDPRRLIRD